MDARTKEEIISLEDDFKNDAISALMYKFIE
jgi:hypothetical protein